MGNDSIAYMEKFINTKMIVQAEVSKHSIIGIKCWLKVSRKVDYSFIRWAAMFVKLDVSRDVAPYVAAWRLNSASVITCYHPFILCLQSILRLCQFEIK